MRRFVALPLRAFARLLSAWSDRRRGSFAASTPHLFVLALTLGSAVPSHAALVAEDLIPGSGDQLLTVDTVTGLAWLDVPATVGQSYNSVLAGSYVTSLGFRYATEAEVESLWREGGAGGTFTNDVGSNITSTNYDAAVLLIELMGCTSILAGEPCDGVQQDWHIAMYGELPTSPELVSAAVVDAFGPPDGRAGQAAMWLDFGPTVDLLSRPDVGSYLVRPVPEVEAPALAVIALGLLVARRCWSGRADFAVSGVEVG